MAIESTHLSTIVPNLGVGEIADAVARREITPIEIVEALLERVAATEGKVQAWSYLDAAGARAQARILSDEVVTGRLRGPLHGVPFGIKDEFHVEGLPTGMRALDILPMEPEDATVVTRLRAAGAIVMGKTHMPVRNKELPTRNPWNQEHTAGGTSSGSGASVGARMVPFAIGEQTMGSNLRPACYCGCAGLKPTYGRISRFGCFPFAWSVDHVGLIGRSFSDLALVLSVLAGPDSKDHTAIADSAPPADLQLEAMRPPRIGLVRNFALDRSEPVVLEALERSVSLMKQAGAQISDFNLPDEFPLVYQADRIVTAAEGATFHADEHPDMDLSGSAGRSGALVPATYYLQARRMRAWLTEKVLAAIGPLDAILTPTTPAPAPKPPGTGNATFLVPWSFLGFPAITVPCGLSPEGLPMGLQFITRPRADYQLLQVGAWTENVIGRLPAPPLP
ncbi:MAG: amidase [Dehalococcoidia bacterium]|nr:amidase [Dehalococcoidia bacterium]